VYEEFEAYGMVLSSGIASNYVIFDFPYAIRENTYFTSISCPFFIRLGRLKIRSRVGVIFLYNQPFNALQKRIFTADKVRF
jgi:hypothetical protein